MRLVYTYTIIYIYLQCPVTNLDTNTGKSKKKNGEANYLYFHPRRVNRVLATIAQPS